MVKKHLDFVAQEKRLKEIADDIVSKGVEQSLTFNEFEKVLELSLLKVRNQIMR